MNKDAKHSRILQAVLSSDIEGLKAATSAGANLDEQDELGMTPLLYAVYRGDLEAVSFLLEAGADPNLADSDDPTCTPLWHAEVDFGLIEIALALRAHGARL